ncbi:MAG: hypothetical protein IPJ84_21015 [Bdellovibrionales bacterium]|nr:hypothetical protein [Bdellovibrionales bacterium]
MNGGVFFIQCLRRKRRDGQTYGSRAAKGGGLPVLFNVAKLNAGLSAGKETDAMETYRRAVGFTFTTVANHLLSGRLPLLDQRLRALLTTCESTKNAVLSTRS